MPSIETLKIYKNPNITTRDETTAEIKKYTIWN